MVAADNLSEWISYSIGRPCFHSRILSARTRQRSYPQAAIGCRFPLEHGFNRPIASAMPVTFQAETAGFSLRTPGRCVSFTHACVKFTHCSGRPHQLIVRTHRAVRFHSTWVTRGLTRDWFANPPGCPARIGAALISQLTVYLRLGAWAEGGPGSGL